MDARYYQGKTNLQAEKTCLPFGERYAFYKLGGEYVDWKQESTAYIVTEEEWRHLNEEDYEVYDYGRYRIYVYE